MNSYFVFFFVCLLFFCVFQIKKGAIKITTRNFHASYGFSLIFFIMSHIGAVLAPVNRSRFVCDVPTTRNEKQNVESCQAFLAFCFVSFYFYIFKRQW
jgi:hypothetical protein